MKKIIGAAALAVAVAGLATADMSLGGNARVSADMFKYTSPSRSTRPDNGDVVWADDTKHNDDIAINGSNEDSGFQIKLVMTSNIDGGSGSVGMTSYQMWTKLFGLRLDAGAYEKRLGSNLNNDGKWSDNLSGKYKTGIWMDIDGAQWGLDSTGITLIKSKKTYTNFMVTKDGLLDGKLTVNGVVFTSDKGTDANGDNNDEKWIFTPFALGGVYSFDKNTKLAVVGKLSSITHTSVEKEKVVVKRESVDGVKPTADIKTAYVTPDNSVWTLAADYYKKLDSGTEVSATYTFGASLYSNWGGQGAHWKQFKNLAYLDDEVATGNIGDYGDDAKGRLVRDGNVFAHGIDFRVKGVKLMDSLSLTALASLNYVQGTEIQKATNRHHSKSDVNAKDSRAKSYFLGAAGQLGYWASVSLDYVQSDTITFQLQSLLLNSNLFAYAEVGSDDVIHVDYFKNMSWQIRPAVIFKPDAKTMVKSGVLLKLDGFQQNATGKANTFKTTVSVPLTFNISL